MKRQCKAFVESSGKRCERPPMRGGNYCFSHYPKREALLTTIFGAVLGAIIGFLVSIFFNTPVTVTLSRLPLFHHLDVYSPTILEIEPNVTQLEVLPRDTRTFKVECSDVGSGLDLSRSGITVYYQEGRNRPIALPGKVSNLESSLTICLEKDLAFGKHLFEVTITDRTGNKVVMSRPFVVREPPKMSFGLIGKKYADFDLKGVFDHYFEQHPKIETADCYVYQFSIRNESRALVFENIHLTLMPQSDTAMSVLFTHTMFSYAAGDVKLYSYDEGLYEKYPGSSRQRRAFVNQQLLSITQLEPNGHVNFAVLCLRNPFGGRILGERFDVIGHFQWEGYGTRDTGKVDLSVPIEWAGR